jgi:hypothetical protein
LLAVVFGEEAMDDIPVMYATKEHSRGVDLFRFDCPMCGKRHTHGYGEGHRIAHCTNPDNFPDGYILKEKSNEF